MITKIMAWNHITSVGIILKQAWNLLIHLCFFNHCMPINVPVKTSQELAAGRFHRKNKQGCTDEVECAVCLSTIEEDDEIRLLRCDHLFHKECLDRCVEYRHLTCPLCRDVLAGPRMVCELGRELLYFSFCATTGSGDDDYGTWWIR